MLTILLFYLSFALNSRIDHRLQIHPDAQISRYKIKVEPSLSVPQKWNLARKNIKHVFIIYQENRSFDHYFGTFPGVEGLYSHPANKTLGFTQSLIETNGSVHTIQPFRIGPDQFASDLDDVDHSHEAIFSKMDIKNRVSQMDNFAAGEEHARSKSGNPSLKAVQYGELTMVHVDGDTIPFLWRYANRFVLCDHIFQQITGPSTPGNLTIFAGQTGLTQRMLHPEQGYAKGGGPGVPVLGDANPFWGSSKDPNKQGKLPYNSGDNPKRTPQINLTFANIAYTLTGGKLGSISKADRDEPGDLADTMDDIKYLTNQRKASVPWGWYEEGFDREPTDVKSSDPLDAEGSHASYVTHHNGPQYFGSIANNPKMSRNLHGLSDLYNAIKGRTLPDKGVFYVKGGFENLMSLKPACPDPAAQTNFVGDDDHPGYSDSQISEAAVARIVNLIARSPYWSDSMIIITYDDSEGEYDHVRPPVISVEPDGSIISDGPRIPFIVVSPYAKTHYIMHQTGNQSSVIKFVDRLFNLTPLADLPDEDKARKIGAKKGLMNQGPNDDQTPFVCDLIDTLDGARLSNKAAILPASYAIIPDSIVNILPQLSGYGLKDIGIVPVDIAKGIKNQIPADFNPRPSTTPTLKK